MTIRGIYLAVASILVLFTASLFTISLVGKYSRSYASDKLPAGSAFLVKKTSDVYSLWKEMGVSGNVLVHCSAYFNFVPINGINERNYTLPRMEAMSGMVAFYENEISYRNFLWVAMQADFVRYIYNVLPEAVYDRKSRAIADDEEHPPFGEKSYSGKEEATDAYKGLLRKFSVDFPETEEPVLINIDASYLSGVDVREFARLLEKTGLRISLLTLCLSQDNPDVAESDREKLEQLAEVLLTNQSIKSLTRSE